MSQYIVFFAKRNDTFIELGEYSRNNYIYEALQYDVPYEDIVLLDDKIYEAGIRFFNHEIEVREKRIEALNDKLEFLKIATASFEEKVREWEETKEFIEDEKEEIKELESQRTTLATFGDITSKWSKTEVYVGIEPPTMEILKMKEE